MGTNESKMKGKQPSTPRELLEKYIGNLVAAHNQNDLKQGICHGMCLDWIQSMINGTISKFKDYSKMKKDQMDVIFTLPRELHESFKKANNVERQRRTDEVISRSKEAESLRQAASLTLKQAEKHDKQHKRMKTAGPHVMEYLSDRTNFETALEQQGNAVSRKFAEFESQVGRVEEISNDVKKMQGEIDKVEKMYPHVYELFKKKYAEKFFKDIDIDQGKHYSWSPEKLSEWFSKIGTCLNLLGNKQCSMLTFQFNNAEGHVIAFYREGENYHLFDPNVGWFQVQSFDSSLKLFEDIWNVLYRNEKFNNSTWRVFLGSSKRKE